MKNFKIKYFVLALIIVTQWSCAVNDDVAHKEEAVANKSGGRVNENDLRTIIIDGVVVKGNLDKKSIIENAFFAHLDFTTGCLNIASNEENYDKYLLSNPKFESEQVKSQMDFEVANKSEVTNGEYINNNRISLTPYQILPTLKHRSVGFFYAKSNNTSWFLPGGKLYKSNIGYNATYAYDTGSSNDGLFQSSSSLTVFLDSNSSNNPIFFRNSNNTRSIRLYFCKDYYGKASTTRVVSLPSNSHYQIQKTISHFSNIVSKEVAAFIL